jgi:hypothetical protein
MGRWRRDLERRLTLDVPMAVGHYDDAGELYPCATARFGICADRVSAFWRLALDLTMAIWHTKMPSNDIFRFAPPLDSSAASVVGSASWGFASIVHGSIFYGRTIRNLLANLMAN